MLKKTLAGAFGLALLAGTANAATTVTSTAFDSPLSASAINVTFEGADPVPLPPGFTLTGSFSTETGTSPGLFAAPAGDATQYLAVPEVPTVDGFADLRDETIGGTGHGRVSFYWGSIDAYNSVELLDAAGNTFGSVIWGSAVAVPDANGNQTLPGTNRRVTITQGSGDPQIYGIRFNNEDLRAFELDNVSFGAVPEPATWAMMIGGFGLVGGAIRRRNRRTTMVTA